MLAWSCTGLSCFGPSGLGYGFAFRNPAKFCCRNWPRGVVERGHETLFDKHCYTSQRVSTDASTLSTRLSPLDSRLSKMGFVQNVANWSVKTQVRNSLAMLEIDWKTSGFFELSERQNPGFCPLQSCWLFRGQNGQNKLNQGQPQHFMQLAAYYLLRSAFAPTIVALPRLSAEPRKQLAITGSRVDNAFSRFVNGLVNDQFAHSGESFDEEQRSIAA